MFAFIAAILFALALIIRLAAQVHLGGLHGGGSLVVDLGLGGLLCVALALARPGWHPWR